MKKLKQMYRCMDNRKYRNSKTTGCPTKTFGHDRQCGFTLVELVIVIAIVIILSVVSVPIYQGYTRKAKFAEAYALCGTILSAQKAYYSEYGNFLCGDHGSGGANAKTCNETVLGIDIRGNKYFTIFNMSKSDFYDPKSAFSVGISIPKELRDSDKNIFGFYYDNGYRNFYEWKGNEM